MVRMYTHTHNHTHLTSSDFIQHVLNYYEACLIGVCVFFAGYEKYNTIRADPALCFLERVGRPDEKAIAAEQRANDFMDG